MKDLNLIFLHEVLNAARVLTDDRVFTLEDRLQVNGDLSSRDPKVGGVHRVLSDLG